MRPRRIVAMFVGGSGQRFDGTMGAAVLALADDGTAWALGIGHEGVRWEPLPGLPPAPEAPRE